MNPALQERTAVLDKIHAALRTDNSFLRDVEETIKKYKNEGQRLLRRVNEPSPVGISASLSVSSIWVEDQSTPGATRLARLQPFREHPRPPIIEVPMRRTHIGEKLASSLWGGGSTPRVQVSFPFYNHEDSRKFHIRINNARSFQGLYSDYADFVILLSIFDPRQDWDVASGGRWVISMTHEHKGIFTSPLWYYKSSQMRSYVMMRSQEGYNSFIDCALHSPHGVMMVRQPPQGQADYFTQHTHVVFNEMFMADPKGSSGRKQSSRAPSILQPQSSARSSPVSNSSVAILTRESVRPGTLSREDIPLRSR